MAAYSAPDFNERAALARKAKQKALDQLRAKPAPSAAELAEREALRIRREEADAVRRETARAKKAASLSAAASAKKASASADAEMNANEPKTEAESKAARDARYAARKARK